MAKEFNANPLPGFKSGPFIKPETNEPDYHVWFAHIPGLDSTPWEGHTYIVKIIWPEYYPKDPKLPKVYFTDTNMHNLHMNVYSNGRCCYSLPTYKPMSETVLKDLLLSFQQFLMDPNPNSTANGSLATKFRENKETFWQFIRNEVVKLPKVVGSITC